MGTFYFSGGGSSYDDGTWSVSRYSYYKRTNSTLFFGGIPNYNYKSWIRFTDITIPKGAYITSAKLKVTSNANISGSVNLDVFFNDVANVVSGPSTGPAGEALVLGDPILWVMPTVVQQVAYYSSDLKEELQKIVNKTEWASGNSVMLVVANHDAVLNARLLYSFNDSTPSRRPVLEVSFCEHPFILDANLTGAIASFNTESEDPISVDGYLEGASANFSMNVYPPFKDVDVEWNVCAGVFEDIPIENYWSMGVWLDISTEFYTNRPDFYNFQNIPAVFYIVNAEVFEDIPVVFSIMLEPQSYVVYVLQKLYCVTTEVGTLHGDMELKDWNVLPNTTWYVKTSGYDVTLYESQEDMLAGTNPVATGVADSDTLEVILTYVPSDEYETAETVGYYYEDLSCHVSLSVYKGGSRFFKVKPLTDLSEIRHPIYNNSNIAISKGQAELDLHTYTVLGKELSLAVHVPTMEPGEIVKHTSTRRNNEIISQILSLTITGRTDTSGESSLVNEIAVANYTELSR
jgi:hypothetical protein